jgi:O-antigen/teichoic acid export membrane protein
VEITFLNAERRQRAMALLVTTDAWLRPIAAVALVWTFGAHGANVVGGYLAGCVIALTVFRLVARVTERSHPRPVTALLPLTDISHRLRNYALPLTALPLIGWVSGQADRYLLGGITGVAAAGMYAALYGLASKPFLMFSAGAETALRQPYYARATAGNNVAERRAIAMWLAAVTGVSLVLWLLFALFHFEIAALLLAAEYRTHSVLMAWVAAGYMLLSMAQVLERVCYAHHDTRGVLWVEASGATLSVVVAAPLVYAYGIEGAAWAVPMYFGAQLLIAAARARRAWRNGARSPAGAASSPAAPVTR